MTAQDVIAQALALSEAATDGPWIAGGSVNDTTFPDSAGHWGDQGIRIGPYALRDMPTAADATFTAAARTLLPALAKALGDVLDQHQQTTAYGVPVCDMCAQVKDADEWDDPSDDYSPVASWLPFPCPTVTAITAALSEVTR